MRRLTFLCPILLLFSCSSAADNNEDPIVINRDAGEAPDLAPQADMGTADLADDLGEADAADLGDPLVLPDTPAGLQLAWVVDELNTPELPTTADIEAHFTDDFIAAVGGASDVVAVFAQLQLLRPWEVFTIIAETSPNQIEVAATTADGVWSIELATTGDIVSGLRFRPAPEFGEHPETWEELDIEAQNLAERADVYVAEVGNGTCTPVHTLTDDAPVALGSVFKLFVLDAWVEGVIAGDHAWDDQLELRSEFKSLPSGDLQNMADGSLVTAQLAAEKMIEISDNTGTDLLIRALGRERVEAQMEATGHSTPQLNRPFLLTRELFQLKVPNDVTEMDAFVAMNEGERRDFLDTTLAARDLPSLTDTGAWTLPRHIDSLEWFATGADICNVAAKFQHRGAEPDFQVALGILERNSGIAYPNREQVFPYVGFKGGSEPGVLVGSWLIRRADDRWFFIFIALNDTQMQIDQTSAVALWFGAFQILSEL